MGLTMAGIVLKLFIASAVLLSMLRRPYLTDCVILNVR